MNIYKHVVMVALFASVVTAIHPNAGALMWGKGAYEQKRFRNAVQFLNRALQHREQLTDEQLIETLDLLGRIYQQGNQDVARDTAKALAYYQEALQHTKNALDETWELFATSRSQTITTYQKTVSHAKIYRSPNQLNEALDDMIISSHGAQDTIALGKKYQRLADLKEHLEKEICALQ